jgi:hypothetical protein
MLASAFAAGDPYVCLGMKHTYNPQPPNRATSTALVVHGCAALQLAGTRTYVTRGTSRQYTTTPFTTPRARSKQIKFARRLPTLLLATSTVVGVVVMPGSARSQQKGGLDETGPYDVIENWLETVEAG